MPFPRSLLPLLLVLVFASGARADGPDIVFEDFEGDTYGAWKTTGAAFGTGPARGTLPGQMPVTGFRGKGLVNSFRGGDGPTGTLTSPEFIIERRYISFLIGGGGYPGKTCMNLLVDGKVIHSATGPNTEPGGSEQLEAAGWDVGALKGKKARLEIVDNASGGWGHINVDHIVFTDRKPPMPSAKATREVEVTSRFLFFPVKNGAKQRKVNVVVDGKIERFFDVELADAKADWWAPLDVSAWRGKKLTIEAGRAPAGSAALASIDQGDELKGDADLYREPLRPQFHFSPKRGWTNDPNGLVFFNGEYHLFFQHNPYGWGWGNMHWGHAVSKDLVHWVELGDALYPDAMGPVFSGSAVVDWKNTSGFGKDGKPPLVLIYTAAGNPTVQCLAYSRDGKSFTKYAGNPVLKQITPGNRDPKVFWHEPTKRWVMTLYVEVDKKHTIHFLTSPDLKDWTVRSKIDGFFECPDFFELPIDGDATRKKWVLTAASSEYMIGGFDGEKFTPETPKLPGHRGRGFYAAQTFSDIPAADGRRIQIGWLQAPSPGMAFNQAMSVPLELSLRTTPDGPRLAWAPVKELNGLRGKSHAGYKITLTNSETTLTDRAELVDLEAVFKPGKGKVTFLVRDIPVVYDGAKEELIVNKHRAPAPLRGGHMELRILVDRTAIEVFASDGLTYVPMPLIPEAARRSIRVDVTGSADFRTLSSWEVRPIWKR
ncbi:MAG: DUF4980 domain-containing protein [Gemmataceae bacterium]